MHEIKQDAFKEAPGIQAAAPAAVDSGSPGNEQNPTPKKRRRRGRRRGKGRGDGTGTALDAGAGGQEAAQPAEASPAPPSSTPSTATLPDALPQRNGGGARDASGRGGDRPARDESAGANGRARDAGLSVEEGKHDAKGAASAGGSGRQGSARGRRNSTPEPRSGAQKRGGAANPRAPAGRRQRDGSHRRPSGPPNGRQQDLGSWRAEPHGERSKRRPGQAQTQNPTIWAAWSAARFGDKDDSSDED